MTRRGHFLFGVGVGVLTLISIWASVAIPMDSRHQAQAQVESLINKVKALDNGKSCPFEDGLTVDSAYAKQVDIDAGHCALTLHLADRAPLARSLRGSRLTLSWSRANAAAMETDSNQWHCTAQGGQGATQSDFPPGCHYQVQDPLL